MNREFHFNTIYVLACEAGIDEKTSSTIAGASQFVDEAVFDLTFSLPDKEINLVMTQTYEFWDETIQNQIYLPFHFIPGNTSTPHAALRTNAVNRFCVIANGTLAKETLIECLEQRDPFLTGIALHGFADTWAHQYFTGKKEAWNSISSDSGLLARALGEPVGHMQCGNQPDICGLSWTDNRLKEPFVDNIMRFREAAKKIFRYLCIYNNKSFAFEDSILDRLCSMWKQPSDEERNADYVINWSTPEWSYRRWFEEAGIGNSLPNTSSGLFDNFLNTKIKHKLEMVANRMHKTTVTCTNAFKCSKLYQWNQAAHQYKTIVSKKLIREHLI